MHIKHQINNRSSILIERPNKNCVQHANQVEKNQILTIKCTIREKPKVKVFVPPVKVITEKPEQIIHEQPTSRRTYLTESKQNVKTESWSNFFTAFGGINKRAYVRNPQKKNNSTYFKEDQLYRHRVKMKRQMSSLPSPPRQDQKKVPEKNVQSKELRTSEVRKNEFQRILGNRKGSLVWREGLIEKKLKFMLKDSKDNDAEVYNLRKELTDVKKMIRQLDEGACAKLKNKESIEIHQELIIEAEEYVAAYNRLEPDSYVKEGKTRRRFRLKQDKQEVYKCPNCTFKARSGNKVAKHTLDIHKNVFETFLMGYGASQAVSKELTKNKSKKRPENHITVDVDVHPLPVNEDVFYDAVNHPVPSEAPVRQTQCDLNKIEVVEVAQVTQESYCKDDPGGDDAFKNDVKKPNYWSRFIQVSNIHTTNFVLVLDVLIFRHSKVEHFEKEKKTVLVHHLLGLSLLVQLLCSDSKMTM